MRRTAGATRVATRSRGRESRRIHGAGRSSAECDGGVHRNDGWTTMDAMHRTQVMLEEWQMDALRARAEAAGTSMSSVIREILTAHLSERSLVGRDVRASITGIVNGVGGAAVGHDEALYGPIRDRTSDDCAT